MLFQQFDTSLITGSSAWSARPENSFSAALPHVDKGQQKAFSLRDLPESSSNKSPWMDRHRLYNSNTTVWFTLHESRQRFEILSWRPSVRTRLSLTCACVSRSPGASQKPVRQGTDAGVSRSLCARRQGGSSVICNSIQVSSFNFNHLCLPCFQFSSDGHFSEHPSPWILL